MIDKDFVAAGDATFTVEPPAAFTAEHGTPAHYTFRVRRKPADLRYPETWFISLLSGPDNESDYAYLGMLDAATGDVRLTRKSRLAEDSWPIRMLRRVLARLWVGDGAAIEAAGWKVHHEGRCGRCGRKLTVPESVESGIGPECRRLMTAA